MAMRQSPRAPFEQIGARPQTALAPFPFHYTAIATKSAALEQRNDTLYASIGAGQLAQSDVTDICAFIM